VAHVESAPTPPPMSTEPRGLEWYLKTRAGGTGMLPPIPVPASPPPAADKPELLGYDQTPAHVPAPRTSPDDFAHKPERKEEPKREQKPDRTFEPKHEQKHEQKKEAELFAYMAGEP